MASPVITNAAESEKAHSDLRILEQRIADLERDRLERRIERQQLNAVVPPAVGGDRRICRWLRVALLDGEPAAVLARGEKGDCQLFPGRAAD
jgi:hypothetical protein